MVQLNSFLQIEGQINYYVQPIVPMTGEKLSVVVFALGERNTFNNLVFTKKALERSKERIGLLQLTFEINWILWLPKLDYSLPPVLVFHSV